MPAHKNNSNNWNHHHYPHKSLLHYRMTDLDKVYTGMAYLPCRHFISYEPTSCIWCTVSNYSLCPYHILHKPFHYISQYIMLFPILCCSICITVDKFCSVIMKTAENPVTNFFRNQLTTVYSIADVPQDYKEFSQVLPSNNVSNSCMSLKMAIKQVLTSSQSTETE